jgi:hypothetical protein
MNPKDKRGRGEPRGEIRKAEIREPRSENRESETKKYEERSEKQDSGAVHKKGAFNL